LQAYPIKPDFYQKNPADTTILEEGSSRLFEQLLYKSKWLVKCIRINAATVEKALSVSDFRIKSGI